MWGTTGPNSALKQAAADKLKQYEIEKDILIAERAQQKKFEQQQLDVNNPGHVDTGVSCALLHVV